MSNSFYKYYEKSTGNEILSENIIAENDEGIIVRTGLHQYKYMPSAEFRKNIGEIDIGYSTNPAPSVKEKDNLNDFYKAETSNTNKELGTKFIYQFGLNPINIRQSLPDKASAFISAPIDTGNVSYIELSAVQKDTGCSTEYSIIEGKYETAILPAEIETIRNEHLFFGKPIRFTPDPTRSMTISKNDEKTSLSLADLSDADFYNDTYTVSYTPVRTAHQYVPEGTSIKIKVVQRCDNGSLPSAITAITILKYGGGKLWQNT